MSKIKLLSIAVIGLLVINTIIVGFLFMKKTPPPPAGPMEQAGPKRIIIERLHFDKEQVMAYEKLIDEHRFAIRTIDDSIRLVKTLLYQTLTNENFTGKNLLINRLGVLQQQIDGVHYNHFVQLKKLCNPGQRNSFNDLTKELAHFFGQEKKGPPPPRD